MPLLRLHCRGVTPLLGKRVGRGRVPPPGRPLSLAFVRTLPRPVFETRTVTKAVAGGGFKMHFQNGGPSRL